MLITNRLWRDENGFIVSSELVLLASVIVLPLLVGMQTVRDAVVQELADVGAGDWRRYTNLLVLRRGWKILICFGIPIL